MSNVGAKIKVKRKLPYVGDILQELLETGLLVEKEKEFVPEDQTKDSLMGVTSNIVIDKENKTVRKLMHRFLEYGIFQNEVAWLENLRDFDRTPNIIEHNGANEVLMDYVGEKAVKATLPKDWEEQMEYILEALVDHNCRHSDISPGEILVREDKIYLVDFGWACPLDKPAPDFYFSKLGVGGGFRSGKDYDDAHAFEKTMEWIIRET